MLGLIKQLASLITVAVNIPNLIKLLTGIVRDYSPGPEDPPAPTPNVLGISYEIGKSVTAPAKTKVLTVTLPQYIIDYEQESSGWRDAAIDRINSKYDDGELLSSEKTAKIDRENTRHNERVAEYTQDLRDVYEPYANGLAMGKAEQIDPAIRTAVAPIMLAIGIPTLLNWLKNVAGGFGDVGITSQSEAEGNFNSALAAESAAQGEGIPVGSLQDSTKNLLLFSSTLSPSFKYENGNLVDRLVYFVNDKNVTDEPNYQLTIERYGVRFPNEEKSNITYRIDKSSGVITLRWTGQTPNFDSDITFKVTGWEKAPLGIRILGGGLFEQRDRASNTFTVPIRFASTYPEQ